MYFDAQTNLDAATNNPSPSKLPKLSSHTLEVVLRIRFNLLHISNTIKRVENNDTYLQ